ncbi:molybdate ABC transporter substrate-binding protein [Marinitenerispora sediminis]|uniref:Molybdate ABC transporter substrate-binding protein n=1 Tax=Marinitenerispora sediminis TaxID=1931232 RepID=A0A368T1V6_9ACTN|nr:molybdate ABC transporter substrate-binding protein [Marinitenerispora sediminis]RCV49294.1 molybdate ABC transporter substrate-binding protein [Marinitenerispora sediminis]RCV50550.1 molybdate ABC transporter substrate-binding protein [Marinitenerispora sediminis]RCV54798.1 molybdate ABC transporter substrate-binding protein [Marinitenerispora sediminis]
MRDLPRILRRAAGSAALGLLLGAAACAEVDGSATGAEGSDPRTLTVFAAASLTDTFEELAERFEADHPGTEVEFNFAGSSELAGQITEGAPADVFASADTRTMALVVDAGAAEGEPRVFARNSLEIAVPPDNPAGITGLADLAGEDVRVALCAEEVPCGAATRTVLEESGVDVEPATWEPDVRAALTRVRLGEVDAALVYRTDVIAAGDDVTGIDFEEAAAAVNDYPVVDLADAPQPDLAAEWVELVRSGTGGGVLEAAGFDVAAPE